MLLTIQRRTVVGGGFARRGATGAAPAQASDDVVLGLGLGRKATVIRRNSAPAELPKTERAEFAHPVLNLPGGF
jgi:hypothetical protein